MSVSVLENDDVSGMSFLSVSVAEPPLHGRAEIAGERALRYVPDRHFVGVDELRYRIAGPDGELGSARLTVRVLDETWIVVAGGPLRVEGIDAPSSGDEPATTVTDVTTHGSVVGFAGPPASPRGFIREPGGSELIQPDLFGGLPYVFAHADDTGRVTGVLLEGEEEVGFVWSFAESEPRLWRIPGARGTRLHAVSGEKAAGALVDSSGLRRGALVTVRESFASTYALSDLPEGSEESELFGLDENGATVGASEGADGHRGFHCSAGETSEIHPSGALWSEARDLSLGLVVGTAALPAPTDRASERPELVGFIHRLGERTYESVRVPLALETRLLGLASPTELAGDFVDPSGHRRGFVTHPVKTPSGHVVASLLDDPEHNSVGSHVCSHTELGPFEDRVATLPGDEPASDAIQKGHVSYAVSLVATNHGYGGRLRYRSAGGPVTFFLSDHASLNLLSASETSVPPNLSDVSGSCPSIVRFFQYSVPESGDYELELDYAPAPWIHLILEPGWVH